MLKPIVSAAPGIVSLDQFRGSNPEKRAVPIESVNQVFKVLHGAYGSLFLAKFSTGELDENGKDKGIRAAMLVWESTLAKYSPDTIETAAKRLTEVCPEFPPNLPQFESICKAVMPRKTFSDDQPRRLPPPEEKPIGPVEFVAMNDGRDWARKILARQAAGARISAGIVDMAKKALLLQDA